MRNHIRVSYLLLELCMTVVGDLVLNPSYSTGISSSDGRDVVVVGEELIFSCGYELSGADTSVALLQITENDSSGDVVYNYIGGTGTFQNALGGGRATDADAGNTITVSSFMLSDAATFYCSATSNAGTAVTGSVELQEPFLTTTTPPLTLSAQDSDGTTINNGDTIETTGQFEVSFIATATGTGFPYAVITATVDGASRACTSANSGDSHTCTITVAESEYVNSDITVSTSSSLADSSQGPVSFTLRYNSDSDSDDPCKDCFCLLWCIILVVILIILVVAGGGAAIIIAILYMKKKGPFKKKGSH